MGKQLIKLLFIFIFIGSFLPLTLHAQTCKVTDYLYLNDPQDYQTQGFVHKLKIGTGGTLTEVPNGLGNIPWFPQGGGLGSPHGLGQDLNGNLYIGANSDTGPIAKITCDGTLINLNFINDAGYNIVSKDGYLFVNSSSNNRISRYALCDGSAQGYVTLNGSTQLDWGLFVSPNGTFYATTGLDPAFASTTGKKAIYRFTPTDADFTNHTDYQPLVSSNDLPPGAAANNLPIPAGGAWLWGITADNAGNMYVVAEDPWFNHQGTTWTGFTWILKYDPNGNLVAWTKDEQTTTPKVGFKGARGILYYPAADVLYLAAGPNGDCVSMVKPSDLSYMGAAAGNVPNQNPKTLRIASEACPVAASTVVDTLLCNLKVGDKLFLSKLIGKCDAPICGGTWTADAANVGMTFNQCDLSFTVNNLSGCGKFTLTNVGGSCGDFTIEVTVNFADIKAPVIAGSRSVCEGVDPPAFTTTTPATSSGTVKYQWQKSTTSCTAGFTDISGATNSTYDPPVVSQTTYYRVVTSVLGGCSLPLKQCSDTSNCVTITLLPKPAPYTICPGEKYTLKAEAGATSIQWYKDGIAVAGSAGKADSLVVNSIGSYSYSAIKAGGDACRDSLCCPVVFIACGTLGDYVWKDANNNGLQGDSGDTAVQGVILELYKNGTATGLKDTTDAAGKYLFFISDSASYQVKIISGIPTGCAISAKKNTGADDTKDSDFDATTSLSDAVTVNPFNPAKKDVLTVDAGLIFNCPTLPDETDQTICSGQPVTLKVEGMTNITSQNIKFVYFTTHQTVGTTIYGSGSVLLGTVANANLTSNKTIATLTNVSFPANTGNTPVTYHVYGILDPAPADASCIPFSHRHIIVNPSIKAGIGRLFAAAPGGKSLDETNG